MLRPQVGSAAPPAGSAAGGLRAKAPAPIVAGASTQPPAELPAWLSEWRLRASLTSPGRFESLTKALSLLAARCYARCGRVRTSALIYADVAVMQLQHGDVERASRWGRGVGR